MGLIHVCCVLLGWGWESYLIEVEIWDEEAEEGGSLRWGDEDGCWGLGEDLMILGYV